MRAHTTAPITQPLPHAPTDPARWLWALDALAPAILLTIALTIGQASIGAPARVGVILIGCALPLAIGTAVAFFQDMSEAHSTWPVAFSLGAVFFPLVALHMQFERTAVDAPVPAHLLTVAFTWTALSVTAGTVIGIILISAAAAPQWAGVTVAPLAILFGQLPALALRTTPDALFRVMIGVAVIAGVAAGVAWLLPERRRWFVIPPVLMIGAAAAWQRFASVPHHLPGRWLFAVDVALAFVVGVLSLAAPPISRWLHGHTAVRIIPLPADDQAGEVAEKPATTARPRRQR